MIEGLVVVTGASGFVGKWTTIELLRAGYSVRGSVRSETKAEAVRRAVEAQLGAEALGRLEFVRLDLLSDSGWAPAMRGVSAVMHVAAQILAEEPKDPQVVIKPAVDGTERVLRFAAAAGVKRIVMTSSIATIGYGHGQTSGVRTYSEADFTNLDGMRRSWAYCIGKTLAERSAWAYARAEELELTTIHPGAILGPALDADASISLGMVTGLLDGSTPAMPRIGFVVSDVRDVAEMHVAALQRAESIGQRYLCTTDYMRFEHVADLLRMHYPDAPVTSRVVPDWLLQVLATFGGSVRQIINDVGNEKHYDASKGERLLGRPYRSAEEAVLSAAQSAMDTGLVKQAAR
ncbi:MAG: NAD-dependent epimerase/dehydratase family protein [Devosia sp.]|uniref:NAD-dependent epimerase/dehydratase family protein n=1 Tax=Devosia sp. TaxID=1871048 RepID=UPI0024C930C5|nr:NAD-dependent epimerase/dehydratase family protein [Devosia sp.]UYO00474.1 MAG: NAD-dependent epimerase/dehydratase family protein [Devosia sp.]